MRVCSAIGCVGERDVILKSFPRKDRRRRQLWLERVNRPGWTPSITSVLCERHFDKDQWEISTQNGKRRLKATAVPTIFAVPASNDRVVSLDHSYCHPFFRKIFEEKVKTDKSPKIRDTIPFEHIRVDMDENENFTPEIVGEDEEQDLEEIGVCNKEIREDEEGHDIENIQCTPDISVYPGNGEPYPIEMVNCKDDNINSFMAEPDENDPLAISAEDKVKTATVQPYFGNRQMFLFVPKETKMVVNIPSATVEPKVNSFVYSHLSTSTNSGTQPKAMLKVKSMERLLDPRMMALSKPSSLPTVDTKTTLKSPTAVYLKEPLTLADASADCEQTKPNPSAAKKTLKLEQNVVTLTSPKFDIPAKVKVISGSNASPPKLKLVTSQFSVRQDFDFLHNAKSVSVKQPALLMPRPDISNDKRDCSPSLFLSGFKEQLFQPGLHKSEPSRKIYANKNIKAVKQVKKVMPQNSQEPCTQFKRAVLNPHCMAEILSKEITLDSKKNQNNNAKKRIGNNDVKLWLDSNFSLDKINSTLVPKNTVNKKQMTKTSSIIVLDPYNSSKSSKNSIWRGVKPKKTNIERTTLYNCGECSARFTTLEHLKTHQFKTCHFNRVLLEKDVIKEVKEMAQVDDEKGVVIVDTSASSDDSKESKAEDNESPQNSLSETHSESDTATENGENKVNLAKQSIANRNTLCKSLMLDNSFPEVPDISAVRFKSYESLKKSGNWGPRKVRVLKRQEGYTGKEPQERFDGKNKSKSLSVGSKKIFDENNIESAEHQSQRVNRRKKSLSTKSSKNKSMLPKLNRGETRRNKFTNDKTQLVIISSSSSTCSDTSEESDINSSSQGRKSSNSGKTLLASHPKMNANRKSKVSLQTNVESDCEISSDSYLSSNSKKYMVSSPTKVNGKRIKEHITLKKSEPLNDEQTKISSSKKCMVSSPTKVNGKRIKELITLKKSEPLNDEQTRISSSRKCMVSSPTKVNGKRIKELITLKKSEPLNDEQTKISKSKKCIVSSPTKVNEKRIKELITLKKRESLNDEQTNILFPDKSVDSFQYSKNIDLSREPIVLVPKLNMTEINNFKYSISPSRKAVFSERKEEIVISDDEDTDCRQKITLNKNSKKVKQTLSVHKRGQVNAPVVANLSREDIVDLTQKDERVKENMFLSKENDISLPKLNACGIKRKGTLDINCKREKVVHQHYEKSKNEDLVLQREYNNKNYSEERCLKSKIEKISSSPRLLRVSSKFKAENKTSKVLRSVSKHRVYKKYKESMKKISKTRVINIMQKEEKNPSKFDLCKKSNKKGTFTNKIIEIKEKDSKKSAEVETRKCQLCGDVVQKLQFQSHMKQHVETDSSCKVCGQMFSHSVLLRRHIKSVHFFVN